MKLLSWIAGFAVLTGLGTGTLAAQPISVRVKGHVTGWYDTSGLVGPGADAVLAAYQGFTQVDWLVTLTDGSTFTQSVQWNSIR